MTESITHDDESSTTLFSSSLIEKHERLRTHLPALKHAFRELQIRLGEGAHEEFEDDVRGPSSGASNSAGTGRQSLSQNGGRTEFCVRRLQEALASAEEASRAETDAPTEVLLGSLDDILAIWNDDALNEILKKRHVRLQEMVPASVLFVICLILASYVTHFPWVMLEPDSFLDDLTRIVQRAYIPTDNDVVRSRLRTVGVKEYRMNVAGSQGTVGVNQGKDWLIYDVGGSRTMVSSPFKYFNGQTPRSSTTLNRSDQHGYLTLMTYRLSYSVCCVFAPIRTT